MFTTNSFPQASHVELFPSFKSHLIKHVIRSAVPGPQRKTTALLTGHSIHPLGPYSVQSVGAASAVSWAIGHNPGWVTTSTHEISKLALIFADPRRMTG